MPTAEPFENLFEVRTNENIVILWSKLALHADDSKWSDEEKNTGL